MGERDNAKVASLKAEWVGGGEIILKADRQTEDHGDIYKWVLDFLDNGSRDPDYGYFLSTLYHSLNFDIPFEATSSVREELLQMARMKIKDPGWRRFPRM